MGKGRSNSIIVREIVPSAVALHGKPYGTLIGRLTQFAPDAHTKSEP